jgi:hypothetical protein
MVPAESIRKTFKRLSPADISPTWFETLLEQEANATSCRLANTFGTCTNNVITRTFGDCTVGGATFSGTVTLTFDDAASNSTCQMTTAGHSITRVPAFTVTGRRGATLTVSKTGTVGQKITKGSGSTFTFTNDGNPTRFYNRRRRNHFRFHHGNDFRHHGNGYQPRESHHERWHAARDQ